MASGAAKRRKASKKKMKKGGEPNTNNNNNTNGSNSSSTHSQAGDDVRSIDERESDNGGEFEQREEEEYKGEQRSVGVAVVVDPEEEENEEEEDYDRGSKVEVEKVEEDLNPNSKIQLGGGEVVAEEVVVQNGISGATSSAKNDRQEEEEQEEEEQSVGIERESSANLNLIGDDDGDVSKPVDNGFIGYTGNSEEKEVNVVVDERKELDSISTGAEEYNSSSLSEKPSAGDGDEPLKQHVDYMMEEVIDVGNAVIGQVHNLWEKHTPVQEVADQTPETASAGSESVITPPPAVLDSQVDKMMETTQVAVAPLESGESTDDNKPSFSAPAEQEKKEEKLLESFGSLPAAAESCNGATTKDSTVAVQKSEEQKVVDEPAAAAVETTTRDVECVKNGESVVKHMDDDEPVVSSSPVVSASRGVDNQKDLNKASDDHQPLMGSTPVPVQRTSMMGCCGLFELFSKSR